MRMKGSHILVVLLAVLCLSACGHKGKIIPRSTMADLYVDLLLADQWVLTAPGQSRAADTTMVYEPIFNRYGYTTEDYIASVDYYLRDPKRYGRILRKADGKLSEKIDRLNILLDREDSIRAQLERLAGFDPGLKLYYDTVYMRLTKEAGLRFEPDSCGRYLPVLPPAPDSLPSLDSLRLLDSLACADSLACLDSLIHLPDSLAAKDSLAAGVEEVAEKAAVRRHKVKAKIEEK